VEGAFRAVQVCIEEHLEEGGFRRKLWKFWTKRFSRSMRCRPTSKSVHEAQRKNRRGCFNED
jgi:hypothetical protein